MYSVNGIPLDNSDFGWRMLRRSNPLNGVQKELVSVSVPGRNGVLQGIPAFKAAPTITLVIRARGEKLQALYALFEKNGGLGRFELTDDSTRYAIFELASIEAQGINAFDELVDVSVTLRFPTADWRSSDVVTMGPFSPATPVAEYNVFTATTSDITDADIFIAGNFGNFELLDGGSGSWLKTVKTWPHEAGTGLLYVSATGQAFRANTATPWNPTSDMSDYVDVSGGGGFRLTPTWEDDPEESGVDLTLTTTNQSGVTFTVRAREAYSLRADEFGED